MDARVKFSDIFGAGKSIIGMLHLAGGTDKDIVNRALREADIYEKEGLAGAIVENYHGSIGDVMRVTTALNTRQRKLIIGVNVLPNNYVDSFSIAKKYGARFIQLDRVAGTYRGRKGREELPALDCQKEYFKARMGYPEILVLGGVWPKYYIPVASSSLKNDLKNGMFLSDAIVVTGKGTGIETPISKILEFRRIIGESFPLIVGAGVTTDNVHRQLGIADAAIVGSYFKHRGNTYEGVDKLKVRTFMDVVREI